MEIETLVYTILTESSVEGYGKKFREEISTSPVLQVNSFQHFLRLGTYMDTNQTTLLLQIVQFEVIILAEKKWLLAPKELSRSKKVDRNIKDFSGGLWPEHLYLF